MRESFIQFQSGKWEIEGFYQADHPQKGVVITHPHPLYGGDMFNPVVGAIVAAYQKSGFTTLRFNFRGAGKSTGIYDQGIGEQADVASAILFMESEGLQEVHLSGYSFGAWVNAMAVQG
ncbi:alpha/beta hydrolase, partial [Desulfosarcina sp.]|uniref:alpha/beta hydrolase n=1 Tax=Desulfosarcina sp. TaxID=2027861 RepID=UPI0035691D41